MMTVPGLAGLVSARRGSRFKKIAYPLGLATVGATVCHPVQLIIIAKVMGKKAYATSQQIHEAVESLWTKQQQQQQKDSSPAPKVKTKPGNCQNRNTCKNHYGLERSVALPTDLASETKTKSEPTSGAWPRARHSSPSQKVRMCAAREAEIVHSEPQDV